MTYGIPPNSIPISDKGEIKLKPHLEWINTRRMAERRAAMGQFDSIELPLHSDVLLGKGYVILFMK